MITFNNIVERFEIFAENHFFIKSFSFGSPDDVDLSKFEEFPLMHLVYTGSTYDAGTKTYNLEVYILDVPHDKKGKVIPQKEAISDSEQCAEDIIADIRSGGNIFLFAQDYEVVNATTTPLEEETKNVLSGVLLDLSVAIPYEWDACNAPIDGVSPGGGEVVYARRGILRMLTIDGATDVQSVRTIKVTNGTLTDDGDGVVTLDTGGVETLEELTDVNIIGTPDQGDVISYNAGASEWMRNGGLQQLLARFKASGTGAQMYDTLDDTTKGYVDILANSATMKVNNSGLTITEASPGVLSLSVAAGTDGNEVEFEAMTIEGSDALSTIADINFKNGSLTYWENATGKIWLRAPNAGNLTVLLPSSSGTLALTTDIPNVPVDSVNGQTGVVVLDTGDIDENGNLYYTEARVAANSAVVANTAKVGLIAGGTTGQALIKTTGTDYDVEWSDQYHDRYQTQSEALRAGATATTEIYYSAQADGDGYAQSASSDTPTAGKTINRKIYYSETAFADPDTGTWVQFTPAPADDATFATVKAALFEYLKVRTGGTIPISLKQTWQETEPSTFLLDQSYGSGAAAAYSTRQLRLAQTDCMVIKRASDSTTQTIGFDVSGNIDESAINTFCSGTTCTVQTWKDQSGNGNDLTGGSGVEPTIYTGGAMVKNNGEASLSFAAGNYMSETGWDGASTSYIFNVLQSNGSESSPRIGIDVGSTSEYYGLGIDGNAGASSGGISSLAQISNGTAIAATRDAMWDAMQFQNVLTVSGDFSSWTGGFGLTRSGQKMYTFAQEFVIYNADKSSDRTSIESNMGDYFTQNTPLLDTYSGAAAAYSLRLLDSTYTGSAIRVRRSSDNTEQDIGFNVFSELDTFSLTAFAGTGDAFVKTWYDQSGSSNDTTQTTTASQPQIVSSGAVILENGKPAVSFDGVDDFMLSALQFTNTDKTIQIVYTPEESASYTFGILNINTITRARFYLQTGSATANFVEGNPSVFNSVSSTQTQQLFYIDWTNSNYQFNFAVDGNTVQNATGNANTPVGVKYMLGAINNGADAPFGSALGKYQEVIIYDSDESANRTGIETNINTFYNIY